MSRVWVRSYRSPINRNKAPATSPWATICIMAPVIPVTLSVAMPTSTTPMWLMEE